MTRRILLTLALLALLVPSAWGAVSDIGTRTTNAGQTCDQLFTTPVAGASFCNDRDANEMKKWDGTRWVNVKAKSGTVYKVIYPEDFGCIGDGTTNDTTCWTSIFALTTGGKNVHVKMGGMYAGTAFLYTPNSQSGSLKLSCESTTIASATACGFKRLSGSGGNLFEASGAVKLTIEDVFFHGNSLALTGLQIHFDNVNTSAAHDIVLDRVVVGNVTGTNCRGIEIGSSATDSLQASDVSIRNPYLQGPADTTCSAIYVWTGNVAQVELYDGVISGWGYGVYSKGNGGTFPIIGTDFTQNLVADVGGAGPFSITGIRSEGTPGRRLFDGGAQNNYATTTITGSQFFGNGPTDDCVVHALSNLVLIGNYFETLRTSTSVPKICAPQVSRGPTSTGQASLISIGNSYRLATLRAPFYDDVGVNNLWTDFGTIPLIVSSFGDQGGVAGQIQSLANINQDMNRIFSLDVPYFTPQNIYGGTVGPLATPTAPTLTVVGTAGATTVGYKVTDKDYFGETLASAETTIATANATLSATNYVLVKLTPNPGAAYRVIYRTTAGGTPATTGVIATLPGGADRYRDIGDAGNAAAVPGSNTTGRFALGTAGTLTSTHRWGATSVADGGTIAHGMGTTPTSCLVSATTTGEFASRTALDGTNITVAIKKHDGTAGTTALVDWDCKL